VPLSIYLIFKKFDLEAVETDFNHFTGGYSGGYNKLTLYCFVALNSMAVN